MAFATYTSKDRYTAFPIGGIGTGTISVDACGQMTDFEIFNEPYKGNKLPYSFFAMHLEGEGVNDTRVLEGRAIPSHTLAHGFQPGYVHGLARFEKSVQSTRYPFCQVDFEQPGLPVEVSLTAFNPLLPLNVKDSAIPAMVMRYHVRNVSDKTLDATIVGSLPNIYGFHGYDGFNVYRLTDRVKNEAMADGDLRGVLLSGNKYNKADRRVAEFALMTDAGDDALIQPTWYMGAWYDGVTIFWKNFCKGIIKNEAEGRSDRDGAGPRALQVASVGAKYTLAPGEEKDFNFVIGWYAPNRDLGWFADASNGLTMKNFYATWYQNAWEAGKYLFENLPRLEKVSRDFADNLYASTLPEKVIESMAYSVSVLRSTTCFIGPDGNFYAWEGSHERMGSCEGTCTHVWNYAQTVAFLFPQLERSARRNEYLVETDPDGKMAFRCRRAFGFSKWDMHAATDGQNGVAVRTWREYLLSGDKAFLEEVYPKMKLCMEYARREWDQDGDGVLEAMQHNTYDIEFYGPNPLCGVMYLAALKAMAAIAGELGKEEDRAAFLKDFESGSVKLDEICYNGEWYEQITELDARPYQHNSGVLSDQLLGQTLASLTGLGNLLPEDHMRSAAKAIWENNFSDGSKPWQCLQRSFVEMDEPGLRLCSWPKGNEPQLPFVYSDEVWTGIEYQVATLFVYLGMYKEAEAIVSAIRDRHDGNARNPYIEVECGNHYARSMAAWGLLPAYSGMKLTPDGKTTFAPCIHQDDFRALYSDGRSWGVISQKLVDGKYVQEKTVLGEKA